MQANYSFSHAQMMQWPVLTAVASADHSFVYPGVVLDRPVCVIGARVLVHLPLASQQVSKAQALIVLEEEGIYIRDLASKNQTYVNQKAVCEMRLQAGDLLQIGPFKYRCEFGFERHGEGVTLSRAELYLRPDGLASRRIVPVEHYTFLIGSRDGCDMVLHGADISLAHAVIFVKDGHRFLRDLSSMSGTFVNDQIIRQVELHLGDQIRIGTAQMEFHPDEPVHAQESAAGEDVTDQPQHRIKFDESLEVVAESENHELLQPAMSERESLDLVRLPWDFDDLKSDPNADTLLMGGSSTAQAYV